MARLISIALACCLLAAGGYLSFRIINVIAEPDVSDLVDDLDSIFPSKRKKAVRKLWKKMNLKEQASPEDVEAMIAFARDESRPPKERVYLLARLDQQGLSSARSVFEEWIPKDWRCWRLTEAERQNWDKDYESIGVDIFKSLTYKGVRYPDEPSPTVLWLNEFALPILRQEKIERGCNYFSAIQAIASQNKEEALVGLAPILEFDNAYFNQQRMYAFGGYLRHAGTDDEIATVLNYLASVYDPEYIIQWSGNLVPALKEKPNWRAQLARIAANEKYSADVRRRAQEILDGKEMITD